MFKSIDLNKTIQLITELAVYLFQGVERGGGIVGFERVGFNHLQKLTRAKPCLTSLAASCNQFRIFARQILFNY